MTSSLDQRRLVCYPSVPVKDAVLGFNIVNDIADRPLLDMMAACGARLVRFHPGWSSIENYATGTMTLPPAVADGLDDCVELGLTPIIVAGYGPPFKTISRPMLTADAPAGSTLLQVDDTALIDPPHCHIQRFPNTQIVEDGKWSYCGGLIDSTDQAAGTITLASSTTTLLPAGTQLQVNRLRYASLPDKDPTHPSAIAFVRLCLFLANEIAARKIEGFVNIWNEPPWRHDRWDNRAGCAFSEPAIGQAQAAQARYLVRRVLAQWGCRCPPVIYSFAVGSSYDVVDRATRKPKPAYLALQRMMALVAQVGDPSPSQWVPAITGVPDGPWPAMFVSVHGRDGAVLFAWQRTYSSSRTASSWTSITTPAPIGVQISVTPGSTIAECVNVVTGATALPTVDVDNVTLALTDEVVALRVMST